MGWSSTISTLIGLRFLRGASIACFAAAGGQGEGDPEFDGGAGAGGAFGAAPAADGLDAFAHEDQAEVAGAVFDVGGAVADAVVGDAHEQAVGDVEELDGDGGGAGVLADVGEGFAGGAVDDHVGADGGFGGAGVVEVVGDAGVGAQLVEVGAQGGGEAAVVGDGGAQVEDELAEPADRQGQGAFEAGEDLQLAGLAQAQPQLLDQQAGGGQDLDGVIVDGGGDAGALVFLGADQVAEQGLALAVGGVQHVQAELEDERGALVLGDVADGQHRGRALPAGAGQGDDLDLGGELAGVGALADQLAAPLGAHPRPGGAARGAQAQRLAREQPPRRLPGQLVTL